MPRKPKKPQPQPDAAKNLDEFGDESDVAEEEVAEVEEHAAEKMRDWRDVEKYKEELSLRRLIDDDLDIDDLPTSRHPRQK
ncbi:MAG TPA: hypothetical protein VHE37_02830 [Nevskiaceae bacterium]|nr:hypothetical protein [Nevskiaceae bacterium]